MKTSVVTLRFGQRDYFGVSGPALESYCARHGYELLVSPGRDFGDGRDMRWAKVDAIAEALSGADRVLYIDADALPVDSSRPVSVLEPLLGAAHLLLGEDTPGHANTGVIFARREAIDILQHWQRLPVEHPEVASTWPLDELGFNSYTLPLFRDRIAMPRRVAGSDSDFLRGSFVRHFFNGNQDTKARRLATLVAGW